MKAGDIVFVTGTGIISWIIRFFDKGKFSHVAIAVSETHILETNWNMKSSIRKMEYENYEIVDLGLSDYQRKKVPEVAEALEGRWYDYLQILVYLFSSRLNNPRQMICSELVYYALASISYPIDDSFVDATPNELYEKLTNI